MIEWRPTRRFECKSRQARKREGIFQGKHRNPDTCANPILKVVLNLRYLPIIIGEGGDFEALVVGAGRAIKEDEGFNWDILKAEEG
jgi:hypothetical protein